MTFQRFKQSAQQLVVGHIQGLVPNASAEGTIFRIQGNLFVWSYKVYISLLGCLFILPWLGCKPENLDKKNLNSLAEVPIDFYGTAQQPVNAIR